MKYYQLDPNEKQILADFDDEQFVEVTEDQDKYQQYAAATLAKNKNINIRLPEKTLLKLKAIAARDGLPYQTLASSAIHRFVLIDSE